MPDTIRIKRRGSGGAGAPAALANAELAFNEMDQVLYYGMGNASGQATSIVSVGGVNWANLASPAFTGTPTAPTAAALTNTTQLATTAFVQAAVGNYLLKTGGTLTGGLTIAFTSGGRQLNIVPPAGLAIMGMGSITSQGTVLDVYNSTLAQSRWKWWFTLGTESGSNAGADFVLQRYDDTGAQFAGLNPFTITRSNGLVGFGTGVSFGSQLGASSTDLSKHLALFGTAWGLGMTSGQMNLVANGGLTAFFQSNLATFNTPIAEKVVAGSATFNLSKDSGQAVLVSGYSNSNNQPRWSVILGTSAAETGSNVGSDLIVRRYTDAGAANGDVININRATGVCSIDSAALTTTATAPTPTAGDNSTKVATTAFVLANAAPLASPTFTGDPKAPTPTAGDNDTSIATTAFVQAAITAGAVTSGNRVLISQTTVASAVAQVDFTTGIDGTYDMYEVEGFGLLFSALGSLALRVSTDGGATFISTASYNNNLLYNAGSTTVGSYQTAQTSVQLTVGIETAPRAGDFNLRFNVPSQTTTYNKLFRSEAETFNATNGLQRGVFGGTWQSTASYNAIRFLTNNAVNITAGTFILYGIKK